MFVMPVMVSAVDWASLRRCFDWREDFTLAFIILGVSETDMGAVLMGDSSLLSISWPHLSRCSFDSMCMGAMVLLFYVSSK